MREMNSSLRGRSPMQAVKCPVCEGRGTVPCGFYSSGSNNTGPERCRSCGETGFLWGPLLDPYSPADMRYYPNGTVCRDDYCMCTSDTGGQACDG